MGTIGKWKSRHLTIKGAFKSNIYDKFQKTKEKAEKV